MNEVEKLNAIIDNYQPRLQALKVEIAELQAYKDVNEDFKTAWEELKAENERLKEELATYGATGVCEVCSDKANKQADKYLGCLKEIKEYINSQGIDNSWNMRIQRFRMGILDLITKAEEE